MESRIDLRFLSRQDILEAGCFDFGNTINIMEDVLKAYRAGGVLLPDKISQIFDEETQDRINCLPATLIKEKVCGVKWVSVFPGNPIKYQVPNLSGIIVLSELDRGFPFAVMDGTFITALRTSCMGAIGAKHLSRDNSEVIGIIGSGEQARFHLQAMRYVRPSLHVCKVASQYTSEEDDFVEAMSAVLPDMEFVRCGTDFEKASTDADVIVTAVSCQRPLLKARTIKRGAHYCHVGGWEDEYEVALMADKIVCDNWESVKHRTQTVSRLYKMGRLSDSDIYADIAELVDGSKLGRESDEEFTYFNSVGLAFVDVAVAYAFYRRAVEKGLGTPLRLQ